ncbi:MAG TPA: hypothetical protein VGN91_00620 [Bosea sp. (in: a-proteobacteria)]|nr:hypothetical protein [Bosea sp. (in: a-proteobacteria)]
MTEQTNRPGRQRLPNRRESLVISVAHPGSWTVHYDVAIGFPSGLASPPREIFISCNKLTTALATAGTEIATLVSIALQHGATLDELASAMPREENGTPQGAAGAVLDAVVAELSGASKAAAG